LYQLIQYNILSKSWNQPLCSNFQCNSRSCSRGWRRYCKYSIWTHCCKLLCWV